MASRVRARARLSNARDTTRKRARCEAVEGFALFTRMTKTVERVSLASSEA